jgi:hypothetical protein
MLQLNKLLYAAVLYKYEINICLYFLFWVRLYGYVQSSRALVQYLD